MSSKSKVQSRKLRFLNFEFNARLKKLLLFLTFCLLVFAFACSIPNLETPECTEARNTVKEFYSFHFGNDMKFTKDNLKQRERYLSNELKQKLENQPDGATDYFTATDDYPKAFRIGNCEMVEPNKKINMQVLLFWKTDTRSEQREIYVEIIKENDNWLVNKVESK
ncbi:MAG: YbjP/YqhG family protein [Acidobacteriota bacterium]|nr:YbjP/YqhG family protein [Acidobacteriota bacterium]